jgi:Coenzyme PQQ synthesis protein D (PqqD)
MRTFPRSVAGSAWVTIRAATSVRRSPRASFRRLENGSAVVLHLDTAQYHGLNEVGAAIWDLADGRTFEEIVQGLREQLEDPPPDLESDVTEFLEALHERELVEYVPATV